MNVKYASILALVLTVSAHAGEQISFTYSTAGGEVSALNADALTNALKSTGILPIFHQGPNDAQVYRAFNLFCYGSADRATSHYQCDIPFPNGTSSFDGPMARVLLKDLRKNGVGQGEVIRDGGSASARALEVSCALTGFAGENIDCTVSALAE